MYLYEAALIDLGKNEYDGTHKLIIDRYNRNVDPLPRGYRVKYEDEWCMTAVSAWASDCNIPYGKFPYECSCSKAIEKLIKLGMWEENDAFRPAPGDLIFYHWKHVKNDDCRHTPDHVGVVESVKGDFITVIEGNYNCSVRRREIPLGWKYIRGYGLTGNVGEALIMDDMKVVNLVLAGKLGNGAERKANIEALGFQFRYIQDKVNTILNYHGTAIDAEDDLRTIADEVIKGKWGNNPERKIKLMNAGYDYNAVQEIVNNYCAERR